MTALLMRQRYNQYTRNMTLYDFIVSEFSPEKRKVMIRWGLIPQHIERDLDIYAQWLTLQDEPKMEAYAELAVRFSASESLVREAIRKLSQPV